MVFVGMSDCAKNQCAFKLIFFIKYILFILSKFFSPIRDGTLSTYDRRGTLNLEPKSLDRMNEIDKMEVRRSDRLLN